MFDANNGYVGYPNQPQMMYNGIQPQQVKKFNNVLTEDEIKKLQYRPQFSLAITEEDHLRAMCNHRAPDGSSYTLESDPIDPSVQVCKICGHRFTPIETNAPEEFVQEITDQFVNLLQTIKISFIDFPEDAARTFYDLIPMAQKAPELFKLAMKNMSKYDTAGSYGFQNQYQGTISMLGNIMNMMGGGAFIQPQPMYQQPTGNPAFTPGQNPFGFAGAQQQQPFYGQPVGYQPGTTGFAYNPQAQPTAPTADPAAGTTTTTVNTQA